jgi:hypothetical protein
VGGDLRACVGTPTVSAQLVAQQMMRVPGDPQVFVGLMTRTHTRAPSREMIGACLALRSRLARDPCRRAPLLGSTSRHGSSGFADGRH